MNEQLHKVRELLAKHGYRCIGCELAHRGPDDARGPSEFEFWSGPKGVVLLQTESIHDHGVLTYCDWPLGLSYEEMEEALK